MILDKIDNSSRYFKSPIFLEIFNKLKSFDIDTPNGIYKTSDSYYFKVMSYETQLAPKIIESHRKEVDVQILLSGKELIKIYKEDDVNVLEKYNSKIDCQFYEELKPPISEIILEPNYMAVFFPNDIHGPLYAYNDKIDKLKKIVIKINETLFSQ
ncbi:YhcH/YjgK/YiaL family protein [Polaribacter sp.]|uniref:YhcH/YjgK/YiaL family protein n=1 Tax=Polaribacter sp. TaxID=1920175 RepID=UPI0026015AE4|nr:YhcH/YjgK/YiaL family protein [Polaribacter sp.]